MTFNSIVTRAKWSWFNQHLLFGTAYPKQVVELVQAGLPNDRPGYETINRGANISVAQQKVKL